MQERDCLTKTEAEERLRFAPDDAFFCPACLEELRKASDGLLFCLNSQCLNLDSYDSRGFYSEGA